MATIEKKLEQINELKDPAGVVRGIEVFARVSDTETGQSLGLALRVSDGTEISGATLTAILNNPSGYGRGLAQAISNAMDIKVQEFLGVILNQPSHQYSNQELADFLRDNNMGSNWTSPPIPPPQP